MTDMDLVLLKSAMERNAVVYDRSAADGQFTERLLLEMIRFGEFVPARFISSHAVIIPRWPYEVAPSLLDHYIKDGGTLWFGLGLKSDIILMIGAKDEVILGAF